MLKRVRCVVFLGLLLGLGSNAFADVYNYWIPASGDWHDSTNWTLGVVPSRDNADPHYATVNGGTANAYSNAGADRLLIGYDDLGIQPPTVSVFGGADLSIRFELMFGMTNNAVGILDLDGTAYAEKLLMGMGAGSSGTINVADGGHLTVGWWGCFIGQAGLGEINLNGTAGMTVYGDASSTGGYPGITMYGNGSIDLEAGVIGVLGDYQSQLQGYIDNGWITAYDGTGIVNDAFYDSATNYTTVTADIPEPTTMVLLGLGGLLLRKRFA